MEKRRSYGTGSVYRNKRTGGYTGKYMFNGKAKYVYGATKREVEEKLQENLVNIRTKRYIESNDMTIMQLLEIIANEEENANIVKESTIVRNRQTVKIIERMYIAYMKIQDVTAPQINECLAKLINDYSNSSILKVYMKLSEAFNKAVLLKILPISPFMIKGNIIRPKSKKQTRKVEAFTLEQQQKIASQLKKKDYKYSLAFWIMLETGMRVGECLALRRADLDFKNNVIHIRRSLTKDKHDKIKLGDTTKTYAGMRDVYMSDFLKAELKKNLSFDFLFKHPNGSYVTPSQINANFKRLCKDIGIMTYTYELHRKGKIINLKSSKAHVHMIRHTTITRAREAGVDVKAVQAMAGHKRIKTTLDIYTSVTDDFKKKETDKLSEYYEMQQLR